MAADWKRGWAEAENRTRRECELEEKKEERLGKKGLLSRVIEEDAVSAAMAIRAESQRAERDALAQIYTKFEKSNKREEE